MQYQKKSHKPSKNSEETPAASSGLNEAEMFPKIEEFLKGALKAKNAGLYGTMTQQYFELAPQNGKEMFDVCGPHMADAAESYNRGMKKLFTQVFKDLEKAKLVLPKKEKVVEDVQIEEEKPKSEETETPVRQAEQETDATSDNDTPLFMQEKSTEERAKEEAEMTPYQLKKLKQRREREEKERAEIEDEINGLLQTKEAIPPPRVYHDKYDNDVKDIWCPGVTIIAGSKELLIDTTVKFTRGRKYGLVGRNGTGKTTLINSICRKEIAGLAKNLHILQVEQEVIGDDKSILEHVLECDVERADLLAEQDKLINYEGTDEEVKAENAQRLAEIDERLDFIDAHEAEQKAVMILVGLGFTEENIKEPSKAFSGGWRMRISIAKVVFCEPEVLFLDEPTNHLDLVALIWLEQYIKTLDITVVIISHARDFLNEVVDEIIELQNQKLTYYKGNFDIFQRTKTEQKKERMRKREMQLAEIAHMQTFVDRFKANAKLTTMAQSRMKAIDKIKAELQEEEFHEVDYVFRFPVPEKLSRPVLQLTDCKIGYSQKKPILNKVNVDVDQDTRVAFVGPNGAGKSTLLKTLIGKLTALDGKAFAHGNCRVGVFTQHHMEMLNPRLSALETFHERWPKDRAEQLRRHLGSFGISDKLALRPLALLSGGQKSRVSFALITYESPQILLLDEPTNHLDYDAINALIESLKGYEGGLVVISHDQYFLNALCNMISIVDDGKVTQYNGTINDYIKDLRKQYM